MTTARDLLAAGPDGYTAARDAAVKERRAAGDRAGANELKALTRPGIAMWAVLAAGADEDVVRGAVAATSALAEVQAASGSREQLIEATRARREAVEAVVDAALGALASHGDPRADDRRDEVRSIVDRLSRHPEVVGAWLDATLRDLPDDDLGFGAFSGMAVAAAPAAPRSTPSKPRARKAAAASTRREPEPNPEDEAAAAAEADAEAERRAALAAARRELADAEAAQGAAEHRLREADRQAATKRRAEEAAAAVLEAAQRALDEASARHRSAAADADSADAALTDAASALEAARARHEQAAAALEALTS